MHSWAFVLWLAVSSPAGAGRLVGEVVERDGAPAIGVTVRAQRGAAWDLDGLQGFDARRAFVRGAPAAVETLALARTGADGGFSLAGLPDGPLLLWADAGARGQAAVLVSAGGPPVTVQLAEAFALEARTLARLGTELHARAGVRLVVVHRTLPLVFTSTSDAAGRVRLGHAPAGQYVAVGAGEGLAPAQVELERPEAPAAPSDPPRLPRYERRIVPVPGLITLVFSPACSLHGTVLEAGRAVAGATVEVTDGDSVRVLRTDAAGRFELRHGLECSQTTYAVRAVSGHSVASDCLQMPGLAVSSCCSTSPDSQAGGDFDDCRLRLTLRPADRAVGRDALYEGRECRCEQGRVFEKLPPRAPPAATAAGRR